MHIDDGLAGSTSMEFLNFIKGEIKKAFGIKNLGPLRIFLGVQFERNLEMHKLWIHQDMFINSLLLKYELTHCSAIKTPLGRNHPLGLSTDLHAPVADLTHSFQWLVGSLLFLQVCSLLRFCYYSCYILYHLLSRVLLYALWYDFCRGHLFFFVVMFMDFYMFP